MRGKRKLRYSAQAALAAAVPGVSLLPEPIVCGGFGISAAVRPTSFLVGFRTDAIALATAENTTFLTSFIVIASTQSVAIACTT